MTTTLHPDQKINVIVQQARPCETAPNGTGAACLCPYQCANQVIRAEHLAPDQLAEQQALQPVELRDAASWTAPGLRNWTGPVAGYPNRQPPWPPSAFRRFRRVMRTSVQTEPGWAELCREIDVESGAAAVGDIPAFVMMRESHGHDDATAYFSLDRWPYVVPILTAAGIGPDRLRIRLAWWNNEPTQVELARGWIVWAHQFATDSAAGIDRTMVYGRQDFDHPEPIAAASRGLQPLGENPQ